MKILCLFFICLTWLSLCAAHRSEALQAMADTDLAACTGQAGISMAIADLVVYHHQENIAFISNRKIDENTTTQTPLTLSNTQSLLTLNAGRTDINGNGKIDPITLDIGMLSDLERLWKEPNWLPEDQWEIIDALPAGVLDRPVIALRAPDWDRNLEIRNNGISLNDVNLGSFSLQGSKTQGWELFLSAGQIMKVTAPDDPDDPNIRKAGMDFEFAFQKHIEAFTYSPSESQTLSFDNLYFAKDLTFSETNASDITASGFFRLGNMREGKPLSIDMGVTTEGRSQATPVLRLDLKDASGSFAVAGIRDIQGAETRNFGPVIAEGIQIHHMRLEFPGRGTP
ncbi:hypothetical protein [Desulfobotulus sp.]|uniref:hypothetical protein n=1 Tax=Desulfobotulus sp. TaxID=1940337 RepID=UPI002A3670AB|nr:hypothetical protein [Desulfobotulus sp.]MDY0161860.1 hypothetical protein [Desulfobotulus sp.]